MAETKPCVLIHARIEDDADNGFSDELLRSFAPDLDVIFCRDLDKNPKLGESVLAAYLNAPGELNLKKNLPRLPNLKVLVNFGVGVDHIDIKYFNERGIRVCNTPDVLSDCVADMALCLMLASSRRVIQGVKAAMGPGPLKMFNQNILGNDVCYATLGIVGMGKIGYKVAERAKAFHMEILYYNRQKSLAELLPQCDFVVMTCPHTPETVHLIDREQFKAMKPTATIVNVARGKIVNTDALVEALRNNTIAAAALDVTDPEPLPRDHPLLSMPSVIVTPHCSSATNQTRAKMNELCLANIRAAVAGTPLLSQVFPK